MQAVSVSPLGVLRSPLAYARALPERPRLRPAAGMILTFAALMAAGMLVSYLNHDYPPPPEVLSMSPSCPNGLLRFPPRQGKIT